jgi:hypothetical protein
MKLKHLITDLKEFEIYEKYEDKKGQFQLVEFAREIGIDIYTENLGVGISGQLVKVTNNKFEIYINKKDNATAQIIAITRQLANFFRHKEYFEKNNILEEVEVLK